MSLPCMGFGSILNLITSASLCGGCLVGLMNERFDELNGFQSKKLCFSYIHYLKKTFPL